MVNQQVLQGSWNELIGKVREKWGRLTESDIASARGNIDELVGVIQRKTGENREAIEHWLQEFSEGAGSVMGRAADTAREYTQRTAETVRGAAQQAGEQVYETYNEARRFMTERPGQSLAMGFGAGLILGVAIALILRR